MKNLLILVFALGTMVLINSCKKCYTCQNECVQCALTINSHTFTHVLCKDSFSTDATYQQAISADTAQGYTCTGTNPTYSEDYCVNKPGDESYINYYNKGKRVTCNEK